MNRLVIIGNGFDLAHGLPTSYRDFIDDLWVKISKNPQDYSDLVLINGNYNFLKDENINNFDDFKNILNSFGERRIVEFERIGWDSTGYYFMKTNQSKEYLFQFENLFFKKICNQYKINNWVDIENEYYELLKECLKSDDNEYIKELNDQFEIIKKRLSKYLFEEVESKYDFSSLEMNPIYEIFNSNQYDNKLLNRFWHEFSKKDQDDYISLIAEENSKFKGLRVENYMQKMVVDNYFLSFNYTSTISEYVNQLKYSLIQLNEIHGRLMNVMNKINFGFGDEMDKHYQDIEEKNDNVYLKNIKSFQYLNTSNYKYFLDLIDSGVFQVYIMGHSCGLSDRTLLNTIFEHHNCRSIKVFYHQKDDGTDNYTEIVQNISRHFNKKKLMREKIVNKTLCKPLPQIQLPKKEK
jgi:hypothetical protein